MGTNCLSNYKICDLNKVVWFQEGPGVRKNQFRTSGVKLLNVGNICDRKLVLDKTSIYISEEEAYGKYKHFLVDEGDLLIASSGIKVEYFDKKITFAEKEHLPLCMNTSTIRFKVIDKDILDINYFRYFLTSKYFTRQIQFHITGSAQLNFGPSHLNKMKIILPLISEQKRIAERLDKVQELIALQKEQLKKLDDLIKSRFIDLFGDPITNSKKFKIDTLNNICDVRDGTHASPEYVLKGYPLITSKNIINGEISLEEVNFITKLDFDNINKRSKVDVGDILLPMIGTIGNPALVEQEPNYAIKNMALIKFWPQSRCSNLYILYLLRSSFLDNIIKNQQRGGTQKFLALKTIRGLQIPIPPISSQVQFADFVTKIEAQKGLLATRLSHLETLYKSLMQEYFG